MGPRVKPGDDEVAREVSIASAAIVGIPLPPPSRSSWPDLIRPPMMTRQYRWRLWRSDMGPRVGPGDDEVASEVSIARAAIVGIPLPTRSSWPDFRRLSRRQKDRLWLAIAS